MSWYFRKELDDEKQLLHNLMSACLNAAVHLFMTYNDTLIKKMKDIIADENPSKFYDLQTLNKSLTQP
jgi:hypothetical protein